MDQHDSYHKSRWCNIPGSGDLSGCCKNAVFRTVTLSLARIGAVGEASKVRQDGRMKDERRSGESAERSFGRLVESELIDGCRVAEGIEGGEAMGTLDVGGSTMMSVREESSTPCRRGRVSTITYSSHFC